MTTVSNDTQAIAPIARGIHANPILGALGDRIEPVRVGVMYRLGLLLVALVMLLLPLVYVGLITGVGYAIYLHAIHGTFIIGGRGRVALVRLVVYIAPMMVGGILVLFMIKPLLSRRRIESVPVTVRQLDQPLLHAFVQKLAEVVRAPRPKRIDVDCQVNASASFDSGLIGWLRGDLVLTIGLPLAAGLTLRQLAGVLAHELGHFAQGGAMRLTYIIRSISAWFARVVYERDQWDDQLVAAMRGGGHWAIQLIAMLAVVFVWLTRLVLKALMIIGHIVSSFMLRQMEFDADRYEARVAGSDAFAQTADRLAALNVASRAAFDDLETAWQERRLCDDLAGLIRNRDDEMPADVRQKINKLSHEMKTGWFDTHPADRDRIASARRENMTGIIATDTPATALFGDFDELSRLATMRFYLDVLGEQVRPEHVFPTEKLIASRGQRRESYAALKRFFQNLIDPRRAVFPAAHIVPAKDEPAAAEQILEARSEFQSLAADGSKHAELFRQSDARAVLSAQVKAVRAAGCMRKLDIPDKQIAQADESTLRLLHRRAREQCETAVAKLEPILKPALRRLELALSIDAARRIASQPHPADQDDNRVDYALEAAATAGSTEMLLQTLAHLRGAMNQIHELSQSYHELVALLAQVQPNETNEQLIGSIMSRSRHCCQALGQLLSAFRGVDYPYEHAEGKVSLSRFVVPRPVSEDNVGAVAGASEAAIDASYGLYMRMLSDLAGRAEQIETSLGLPPLAEMPPAGGGAEAIV